MTGGNGKALHSLLDDTKRRLRNALGWALFGGLGMALLAVLLLSAVLVSLGLGDAGVGIVQLVCSTLAVGGSLTGWVWSRRWTGSEARIASFLDQQATGADLLAALELQRDRGRFGASHSLTDAAVRSILTEAESRGVRRHLAERVAKFRARMTVALTALLFAVCAFGAWAPRTMHQALTALGSVQTWSEPWETVPPEPRLGDVRITYRYPDYAGRPPRRVVSTDGAVKALAGTEVTVEATAEMPLREASLELELGAITEAENTERVAATVDGSHLGATFVLRSAGAYRIRLVDRDGRLYQQRRGRLIRVEADEIPTVELLAPEVSPLELNEGDELQLRFRAKDDFGLTLARLRWRVLGRPTDGTAELLDFGHSTEGARAALVRLADMKLQPGDQVAYSVEVLDSDTVNGPKVGASRTQELRIYSRQDHHRRVLEAHQKALDELVHLLGDHLDEPFTLTAFRPSLTSAREKLQRAGIAQALLHEAEEAAREDPLGRSQIADAFLQTRQGLKRQTRRGQRSLRRAESAALAPSDGAGRRVQAAEARMTRFLEKNAVYLADLLNDQRIIDAEALAKELRDKQQALREALEAYRNAPSEELRAQIAQSIQAMKDQIQALMKEMARLQSSIPTDFVNRDALQQDQASLDDLFDRIENGQLDQAMDELDQLMAQTERMLSQLQDGRQQLQSREYSEVTQRAEEIWQELEDVRMRQEELARRTEAIANETRQRASKRVEGAEAFIEKQLERLRRAETALERGRDRAPLPDADRFDTALQRIQDAKTSLETRDFGATKDVLRQALSLFDVLEREAARRIQQVERFGGFLDGAKDAEAIAEHLENSRPPVQQVLDDLERITPSPDSVLRPEERKTLESFGRQQRQLQGRTEELQRRLEELSEQLPIVGDEVKDTLGQVRQSMGEAAQKLGDSDAPGGLGRERQALEGLRQVREQLQQMGQERYGGGQGQGVPLPFGFGRPRGGGGRDGSGRDMASQERVEIPSPESYEAPAAFREELLEAAKQGTVESFRDAVRRYYEELVK
ncbi:MAG: DUF4175 family protein [Myxococcota bacterium]